jgi:hypothetical protein
LPNGSFCPFISKSILLNFDGLIEYPQPFGHETPAAAKQLTAGNVIQRRPARSTRIFPFFLTRLSDEHLYIAHRSIPKRVA